jgi:hypothetical protein
MLIYCPECSSYMHLVDMVTVHTRTFNIHVRNIYWKLLLLLLRYNIHTPNKFHYNK